MEQITLKDILYLIGAITAVISFVVLIEKPYKALKETIETQQHSIDDLLTAFRAQQKLLNSSLKVEMLMMQHMIYGNHTEDMKETLQELQETIIENNSL